jgi:flagellar protein FlaG
MSANILETGLQIPLTPVEKRKAGDTKSPAVRNSTLGTEVERFISKSPGSHPAQNVEQEIANLERISLAFNKKLQFVINHDSAEITINVIDPETDKVIKVLPPEELQRLNTKIEEAIGFLFDEKV